MIDGDWSLVFDLFKWLNEQTVGLRHLKKLLASAVFCRQQKKKEMANIIEQVGTLKYMWKWSSLEMWPELQASSRKNRSWGFCLAQLFPGWISLRQSKFSSWSEANAAYEARDSAQAQMVRRPTRCHLRVIWLLAKFIHMSFFGSLLGCFIQKKQEDAGPRPLWNSKQTKSMPNSRRFGAKKSAWLNCQNLPYTVLYIYI